MTQFLSRFFLTGIALFLGTLLSPNTGSAKELGGVQLELQKIPDIEIGKAVILAGNVSAEGDRFFIQHLSIVQPVTVTLMARDISKPLSVSLSKYRFDETTRSGTTGKEGAYHTRFRTEGELKLVVNSDHRDAGYFLVVWAGDEVKPLMDPPVRHVAENQNGTHWILWTAPLLFLLLLIFIVRKKRSSLFLLLLCPFLFPNKGLTDARSVGSLGALNGIVNQEERRQEQEAVEQGIQDIQSSGVDRGLGYLNQGIEMFGTVSELLESVQGLHPDDAQFDPNFSPEGMPTVPVQCGVEETQQAVCQECYRNAYEKLNFVRFYLERLRAIYGATTTYARRAIAFGDSMSGIHGGFGVAWPAERKGIEDSVTKLKGTYDKKYEDYMKSLKKALDAIAECEKKHFGVNDWYSRFGFMYFTFIQDRYRRDS